jgi:hypothetical protein
MAAVDHEMVGRDEEPVADGVSGKLSWRAYRSKDAQPRYYLVGVVADDDRLLVLTRGLLLLRLLIAVLRVIEHPTNRGLRVGRDLDEVEIAVLGVGERLVDREDPDLFTVRTDQTDLGNPDPFVDPRLVPLRHTPVEALRNCH